MNSHESQIHAIAGLIDHWRASFPLVKDLSITAEHFTDTKLRGLYDAVLGIAKTCGGCDRYLVGTSDGGKWAELLKAIPIESSEVVAVKAFRELATDHKRRMITELANDALQSDNLYTSPDEAIKHFRERLTKVQASHSGGIKHISDVLPEAVENWRKAEDAVAKGTTTFGIPLPWPSLTASLGGLRYSIMSVVGAWAQTGKSSMTRQIAYHAAASGFPVGLLTLEDPSDIAAAHIASLECRFSPFHLDQGRSIKKVAEVEKGIYKVGRLPVYLWDRPSRIADVEATCEIMHERHGVQLFIVDHIQYILEDQSYRKTRNDEVAGWSGRLAAIPRRLNNSHLIAVSQLRKKDGVSKSHTPSMHDLRDSGAIGQDARAIVLLYKRQQQAIIDGRPEDIYIAKVEKNNYGIAGTEIEMLRRHGPTEFKEVFS